MTKADIINEIAASTGLQKKEVAVVVESFMSKVKESLLEKKENVYLRGFGSFIIKHRAAKTLDRLNHWSHLQHFTLSPIFISMDKYYSNIKRTI